MNIEAPRGQSDHRSRWITLDTPPRVTPAARARRVLLADDVVLGRECLARVLRQEAPAMVVDIHPSAEQAYDIALLNIHASPLNDAQVLAQIAKLREVHDGVPIIVISDLEDSRFVLEAMRLRLRGYFQTSLGLDVLLAAIGLVLAGGTYIPEGAIAHWTAPPPSAAPSDPPSPRGDGVGLTRREADVLRALRLGKPNKIIAFELTMSEGTVKVHVRNIMKKLSARNRTQLAIL